MEERQQQEQEVFEPGFEEQEAPEREAQEPEIPAEGPEEPYVETRDGKHKIPYKVLEETRQQLAELKRQNELLQQIALQGLQSPPAAPDPLADLLAMDKDQFRQYVTTKGVDALYELREAVKRQAEQEADAKAKYYTSVALQKMMAESKQRVLRGLVVDWAEENKDILQDPLGAELARAVDRALFKQAGVSDLDQLGPARAKKHLDEVAAKVRALMGALGTPQKEQKASGGAPPVVPNIGRIGGDQGTPKSLWSLSGPELELALLNMKPDEIDRLLEE